MVVANAGNAAGRLGRARRAARRHGAPSSTTSRSPPASSPSRDRARSTCSRPLTDVDLGRAALLRDRRGHVAGHPGAGRADRLHRRGRLRGLRRDRPTGELWDALLARARPTAGAGRPRRARHAAARGRHAALRQRARPRRRPRSRPASAGSSSSTSRRLRRPRGPREGRRRGPRRSARRPRRRGRGIARGTAIRSTPANGGPASSPAGRSRRPSASRSRWPTSRRPTPSRVPGSRSRSATRASPRGSSPAVLPEERPLT